ncbi:MAG: hypothetical protein WA459_07010 [Stellaceae bacterium]
MATLIFVNSSDHQRPRSKAVIEPDTAAGLRSIRSDQVPPPSSSVGFSIAARVKLRPDHFMLSPFCAQLMTPHGVLASLRGRRQAAS